MGGADVVNQEHRLELGSLDLTSGEVADGGYKIRVVADGATFGSPQPIVKQIVSMLADGDLARYDRAGNREVSFVVQIEGADGVALADGEVALRRELYRPNTVTWTPPADLGPATVFEVLTSDMAPRFDDIDELRSRRVFQVNLTCAPFARSLDPVTVEALNVPTSETLVTVDTCNSATGWSATVNAVPAVVDMAWQPGAVSVKEVLTRGPQTLTLTRTGSVSFSTTPYLKAEIGYNAGMGPVAVTLTADGDQVPMLDQRLISPGRYLYTYDLTGLGSVSSLTFSSYTTPDYADLKIFNLDRTDMPPVLTPRQMTRFIEAGGTERTPASIHVASSDGNDLGLTFVHTSPKDGSGYSPPLRRWRVSGGSVQPEGQFSGSRELISPSFVAHVPTAALPEGGYQLVANLRCPASSVVPVTFDLWTRVPDGGGTLMGNRSGKVSYSFTANVWEVVVLAVDLTLPTVRTKSGEVVVYIGAESGVELDEAWLFRMDDDCALSYVNVVHPNLWLDSPNLSSSVPTVWVGDSLETRTHPGTRLAGMGSHVLHPDGTATFAATAASNSPEVSAEFYRRWHSNAAE